MGFMLISLYTFLAIVSLGYWLLRKHFSYFAKRGILHEKPVFFIGNLSGVGRTKPLREPFFDFYRKYKNQAQFGGFYMLMQRALVIFDLDLVRQVLIKDFNNFATRGNYYNECDDPLSAHVFNLDGEKWRKRRAKLTPTFTSGKMKFMYPTMVEVGERFVHVLKHLVEQQKSGVDSDAEIVLDIKDLLARFTTDVIGSCAFGLECNSLQDPKTKFRLMGKKILTEFRHNIIVRSLMQWFPDISRTLGLKVMTDDVIEFFMQVVRDTVAYREQAGVQRNDFMNLLIELKNKNDIERITLEQIAAEVFVFFIAGFETSSTTMGFAFYELAVNQQVQDKLRHEVNRVLKSYDDKLSYEALNEMKYLQQVIKETLRKYSIASILIRKTVNDYAIPNNNFIIEKGTTIIVPVDAIHRDPDIYPNPDVFEPERFALDELEKRHPMSWLPFGDGPRNCIGSRFGEMQAKVGLVMLLKHFRFSPAKSTTIPIEINVKSLILGTKGSIMLKVEAL